MISLLIFASIGWSCWKQNLSSLELENTTKVIETEISPLFPKVGSTTVNISVPYYKQPNDYYCGDACLEMVFDFFGENISQLEIADVARTVHPDGTWEDDMRRATHFSEISTSVGNEILGANITGYSDRRYGYVAFEQRFTNAQNITQFIDAGYPLIVLMLYNYPDNAVGHFRVVTGYIADDNGAVEKFIVHDPWNYTWPGTYQGPGVEIKYSNFTECWAWANNWSLFLCPWTYTVEAPPVVEVNVPFTVSAKLTNLCPAFGNSSAGNLTLQNATIQLPPGFELAGAETLTKTFGASTIITNETSVIEWQVVGTVPGASGSFTINATSLVNGTTVTHPDSPAPGYFYTDIINGTGISNIITVNVAPELANSPPDITYECNVTGHIIQWNVTDELVSGPTYVVYKNDSPQINQTWNSGEFIPYDVDDLPVGDYNFTLIASDGLGDIVEDQVIVYVQNILPAFQTPPSDITYECNITGHVVRWNITDNSTMGPTYVIYQNESFQLNLTWTPGVFIEYSVDGLSPRDYNVTIIASDGLGGVIEDEVIVLVQNVNPVIPSPPADISYDVETVGHYISWVIHDLSVAHATYALRRNGVEVENHTWTSDVTILIPVDGLSMGRYTFTLVVADGLGGIVIDEVDVSVDHHSVPPYNWGLLIGLVAIGSFAGVAFVYKWKNVHNTRQDPQLLGN